MKNIALSVNPLEDFLYFFYFLFTYPMVSGDCMRAQTLKVGKCRVAICRIYCYSHVTSLSGSELECLVWNWEIVGCKPWMNVSSDLLLIYLTVETTHNI